MKPYRIVAVLVVLSCFASVLTEAAGSRRRTGPVRVSSTETETARPWRRGDPMRVSSTETETARPWRRGGPVRVSSAKSELEAGTLFPGESYTFRNVTMTWEISDVTMTWKIDDKSYEAIVSVGTLTFEGPTKTITDVPLFSEEYIPKSTGWSKTGDRVRITLDKPARDCHVYAYLDEVVFWVYFTLETSHDGEYMRARTKRMQFTAKEHPSEWTFDARESGQELYVSNVNPLLLDSWKVSISEKPIKYPDGSEYFQLVGLDTQSGVKNVMAVSAGAMRKFGRFDIRVGTFCKATRTAALDVHAERDLSVRGGGAYVEHVLCRTDETYADFLGRLGEKYGFKVEWVEYPGYPESIEYAKNLPFVRGSSSYANKVVSDLLETVFRSYAGRDPRNQLALEWTDPSHLRVWPKNYDDVIADREKKAREEEGHKRFEAQLEADRKHLQANFEKEYALQTRLYQFERMSAPTAKTLVDSELSTHFLARKGPFDKRLLTKSESIQGKWFFIGSTQKRPVSDNLVIAKSEEKAVADERTNSLIVTAIPKTHEKISEILYKMDALLSQNERRPVPKRYRVEAVLLTGRKKERKTDQPFLEMGIPGGIEYDPKLAEIYGISKEELDFFGLDVLGELGKGFAALLGARGEAGRAKIALTSSMSCELEFLDVREPYVIVKGWLTRREADEVLLENGFYLEKDKPSVLGLTNLREALILVLRLHDTP